jgi:nucleoside permease NupC
MGSFMSLIGLFAMVGIAYALSSSRKHIRWKTIITGIILQITFGAFILKTKVGFVIFESAKNAFTWPSLVKGPNLSSETWRPLIMWASFSLPWYYQPLFL